MLLFLSQNQLDFVYKTFTFFGWSSHTILLSFFSLDLIWALSISLAATLKIEFFFLFVWLLRCFSSPTIPSCCYVFTTRYLRFAQVGFPIRIFTDQWIFAPPRDFSQLITSFFGSQCQGIHLMPLVA